ncbi:MAG: hypothetical protein ACJ75J_04830 [Cytophagaceae bacterium]
MKKILIIACMLACVLPSLAQTNTGKEITLSDTFCFSNHKPLPFVTGTRIYTLCDTLYIINKHRYMLYEKAADVIRDKKYINTCNVLIQNYEDRLQAQNKAFYALYDNYIKLDSVSQRSITDTKNSLVQVNNTIASAQNNIVVVDKKMDDLKKTINEQRRKSFFDKILYGIGGIAVGILGGLIIAN